MFPVEESLCRLCEGLTIVPSRRSEQGRRELPRNGGHTSFSKGPARTKEASWKDFLMSCLHWWEFFSVATLILSLDTTGSVFPPSLLGWQEQQIQKLALGVLSIKRLKAVAWPLIPGQKC